MQKSAEQAENEPFDTKTPQNAVFTPPRPSTGQKTTVS
jgi:hypothetical protein